MYLFTPKLVPNMGVSPCKRPLIKITGPVKNTVCQRVYKYNCFEIAIDYDQICSVKGSVNY